MKYLALFWFGAFNLRSAGCAINDMWDKNIDDKVERTKDRPLASNKLSYKEAMMFTMMHLSGGLFVLYFLNASAIMYSFYGFFIGWEI